MDQPRHPLRLSERPRVTRRTTISIRGVAASLVYVTQVAPYRDGPAGVHGVLGQSATAVAQLADAAGLGFLHVDGRPPARRGRRRRARPSSRCSPSARRRGRRAAAGRPARRRSLGAHRMCSPSTRRPTAVTGGTTTAASSAPASTATRGRRTSRCEVREPAHPALAHLGPSLARGTTRCTSSATCGPTPGCCSQVDESDLDLGRPRRGPSRLRLPALVVLHRGRGPGVLHLPRALPGRVGERHLPAPPRPAAWRGLSARAR